MAALRLCSWVIRVFAFIFFGLNVIAAAGAAGSGFGKVVVRGSGEGNHPMGSRILETELGKFNKSYIHLLPVRIR